MHIKACGIKLSLNMLTSVSRKYKAPALVNQESNEESNVSQLDLELATETQRIANTLTYTICKIELVVSPLNI
jgi:hypothetical protein